MWEGSKFTHGKFCWMGYFYCHFHRFKQTKISLISMCLWGWQGALCVEEPCITAAFGVYRERTVPY